jgi:3-methyladenine DNA glycosylase AlkD
VGENQYGVSYASLGKLKKRLKVDHALALALWASGNHDARVLATMVADPQRADAELLDTWAGDLDCYPLADALSDLAARTPPAREVAETWMRSEDEWVGYAGWTTLARLAGRSADLSDEYLEGWLDTIERDIHDRRNYARHAMNNALIAIGVRNDRLEEKALAAAARIGTVQVDHGETSCTTPDAVAYVRKTAARRRAKQPAGV